MAYIEIDPDDFVKALRMLHSRTPESSDELKKLLDSYYTKQMNNDAKKSKDFANVFSAIQSLNQDVKNESERRHRASEDDSEATDIEDNENTDAGDFANDLGLACVVCKQMEITTNNQLFECQDCNGLYHQECHKPPITKKDIDDPRLVWYCSKCSKNMKKVSKPIATNKLAPNKQGAAMNLASNINSSSPTASPYSTNYQNASAKDMTVKAQPNYLKMSESEKATTQQPFKRGPGKFSSFTPAYSANAKSSTASMATSSINRPSSSAALSSNKGKLISSSSSNTTSSFSPMNALQSLDKRFPNLKKAKMAKYNN